MTSTTMGAVVRCSLLVLTLLSGISHAFVSSWFGGIAQRCCHDSSSSYLNMISFGTPSADSFPRDVKEAISKCRAAVQEALGDRISRMDVEFPVGTKFGVEKQKGRKNNDDSGVPTRDVLDTSDRELARLFVEMFQPVGGENIATIFKDNSLAERARKTWKGDSGAYCRVLSMDRQRRRSMAPGKSGSKKQKLKGFAAKMAAEVDEGSGGPFELPDGIEVALFVSPGPKELLVVEKICEAVGMGTLVVLLNTRLSRIDNFGSDAATHLYQKEFLSVFHLGAAPQDVAPGLLLHRQYPGDWLMARQLKVGKPKLLSAQKDRPSAEDCQNVYESIELGDREKGVEGILENVAGWFT